MSFLGLTAADAALGAGIIQGGTGLLGGIIGAQGQQATNAQQIQQSELMFNQQQTADQHFMDQSEAYNTLMANSAYQRSMEDMKLAGLNPILAAGGNVTNVGSSPMASISPVGAGPLGNPGAAMGAGVASAGQAATTMANVRGMLAAAETQDSQKKNLDAQTDTQKVLTGFHQAATDKARADAQTSARGVDLVNQQIRTGRAQEQDALTSAGYNAARTITEQSNATTASARARTAAQEAINAEQHGPGQYGDILATVDRATSTGPVGYIRNWGEALFNKVRNDTVGAPPAPRDPYGGGSLGNARGASSTPLTIEVRPRRK